MPRLNEGRWVSGLKEVNRALLARPPLIGAGPTHTNTAVAILPLQGRWPMIGAVRFLDPDGDEQLTAVLEDDGSWTCPRSPAISQRLNSEFSPVGTLAGELPWGHWSLAAVAQRLSGQAFIPFADAIRGAIPAPHGEELGRPL